MHRYQSHPGTPRLPDFVLNSSVAPFTPSSPISNVLNTSKILTTFRFLSPSPLSLSSLRFLRITKTVFLEWSQFFLVPIYYSIVLQNFSISYFTIPFSPPKIIWYLLGTTISRQSYFVWFSRSCYQFPKSALLTRHPPTAFTFFVPSRLISPLSLCSRALYLKWLSCCHSSPWDFHFPMAFSN